MFKDPYKNIHGQSVSDPASQPTQSQSFISAAQSNSVPNSPVAKNTDPTSKIIAGIIIFIVACSAYMMITELIKDIVNSRNGIVVSTEEERVPKTSYSITEIGEQFTFNDDAATFTATKEVSARAYYNNTVELALTKSKYDKIYVHILDSRDVSYNKIRQDCATGANRVYPCEEWKDVTGLDEGDGLMICKKRTGFVGEEDLCNFDWYYPLDGTNENAKHYVQISYIPLTTQYQSFATSFTYLALIRETITPAKDEVFTVDEMARNVRYAEGYRFPEETKNIELNFEEQSIKGTFYAQTDNIHTTYTVTAYFKPYDTSKFELVNSYKSMMVDLYKSAFDNMYLHRFSQQGSKKDSVIDMVVYKQTDITTSGTHRAEFVSDPTEVLNIISGGIYYN